MLNIFDPVLGRVKGAYKLHGSSYFVRKAYITNFRPLVPFLHVKKFVVGGGWVLGGWILVLSLDPSLTKFP